MTIAFAFLSYLANSFEVNKSVIYEYPCKDESDCHPIEIDFLPGIYRIELWGAQGGDSRYQNKPTIRPDSGGKGGYVKGTIEFQQKTKLYLYIGGKGEDQKYTDRTQSKGGYNGGGKGGVDSFDTRNPESGAGGGGSTDLRIIKGDDQESLESRIIVAAGGGGGCSTNNTAPVFNQPQHYLYGGYGGGLTGENVPNYGIGGNQTHGIFGKGGDGIGNNDGVLASGRTVGSGSGGCGSGYYGGYIIPPNNNIFFEFAGSGGSSFISGHKGCIAIKKGNSNKKDPSIHYSNLYFTDTATKTKIDDDFVDPNGKHEKGHSGNGCAKITLIEKYWKTNYIHVSKPSQLLSHSFLA